MNNSQKALQLDKLRTDIFKKQQKRQLVDQAYKLVEARQKTIDQMVKQVQFSKNKAPAGGRNDMRPQVPTGGGYWSQPPSQPMRSSSLPSLVPPYQQHPYAQANPMIQPYQQTGLPPQQLPVSVPSHFVQYPPVQPPAVTQPPNLEPSADPMSSQHLRPDIRNILDQNTLKTQEEQSKFLDLQRKQLTQAFKDYRSKELQEREANQKQYYKGLSSQIQQVSAKEQQLHESLAFQQSLLFQMMQNVSNSSQKAETQKEKNQKLLGQIKQFERKNKKMKDKINQALLLNLGTKVIDDIQPGDADDANDMKAQLKALILNDKGTSQLSEAEDQSDEDEY